MATISKIEFSIPVDGKFENKKMAEKNGANAGGYHQPSEREQIVLFRCFDLHRKPPDPGEHQYKLRN